MYMIDNFLSGQKAFLIQNSVDRLQCSLTTWDVLLQYSFLVRGHQCTWNGVVDELAIEATILLGIGIIIKTVCDKILSSSSLNKTNHLVVILVLYLIVLSIYFRFIWNSPQSAMRCFWRTLNSVSYAHQKAGTW